MQVSVRAVGSLAFSWLVLTVVVLSLQDLERPALPLFLGLNSLVTCAAAVLASRRSEDCGIIRLPHHRDVGFYLLLVGGVALYLQVAIRLLNEEHFSGSAANFDFGLKCDHDECEQNVAFVMEFNSFGHCLQGCFFVIWMCPPWIMDSLPLTFPMIMKRFLVLSTDILSLCVVVYPLYNILKRSIKHGATFATSSFCNNGAEWCSGFALGFSLGLLLVAWCHDPPETMALASSSPSWKIRSPRWETRLRIARICAGGVMCAVALVAAIMFGMTWDNVDAKVGEHEDGVDAWMLVFMVSLVVILVTAESCVLYRGLYKAGPRSKAETTSSPSAEIPAKHDPGTISAV